MRRTSCLGVFTRFSGFGHNLPYPGSQQHQTSTSSSSPQQQQQEQPQQQESEYRACNRNDEIATSFPSKLNEHYINWRSNSSSSSNLSNNNNNNRTQVEYHNDIKYIDNQRNELGKTNNKYTSEDNNSVNAHLQQEQSASEVTTSTSTSSKTTISSLSSLSPKSPTSSSQYLQIYDRVGTDAFGAGGVIASARILYSQRERLDLKFLSNYLPDVYSLPHSLTTSSSSSAAATSQLSSTFNRTNSNIINSDNINENAKHENSTMSNAVFASQNASRSVRGYSHHFLTHRNKRVFSSNNNIVNNINVTNISKEHERERDALRASVKVLHCKRRVTAYELKYYVKRERHSMSHQSSYHQANAFPVVFVERDVTSREEMYSSYEQIYQQYIEHRLTNATELLSHSEAPAPAIVLRRLLSERTPSLFLVQYALMAIIFSLQKTDNKSNNIRNNNNNNNNVSSVKYARNSGQTASSSISPLSSSSSSTSAWASMTFLQTKPIRAFSTIPSWKNSSSTEAISALQEVWHLLKYKCPVLYEDTALRVLLLESLLLTSLVNEAVDVLSSIPLYKLTERVWRLLVEFATETKLPHSIHLWRLLNVSRSSSSSSELSCSSEAKINNNNKNNNDALHKRNELLYSRTLTSCGISKLIPSFRSARSYREQEYLSRMSSTLELKDVIGWERDDMEDEYNDNIININDYNASSAHNTNYNSNESSNMINSFVDNIFFSQIRRSAPQSPLAVQSSSIVSMVTCTHKRKSNSPKLLTESNNTNNNNNNGTKSYSNVNIHQSAGVTTSEANRFSMEDLIEQKESKSIETNVEDSVNKLTIYNNDNNNNNSSMNILHWCLLNESEMYYSKEHYGCDSIASADDRAEDVEETKLFISAAEYENAFITNWRIAANHATRTQTNTIIHPTENNASTTSHLTELNTVSKNNSNNYNINNKSNNICPSIVEQPLTNDIASTIRLRSIAMEKMVIGSKYALDAKLTTALLLRPGVSFAGQSSPLLAVHILKRYLSSCRVLRDETRANRELIRIELDNLKTWREEQQQQEEQLSLTSLSESESSAQTINGEADSVDSQDNKESSLVVLEHRERGKKMRKISLLEQHADALNRAAAPHPSPFFVFFQILRDTRDVVAQADEHVQSTGRGSPIRLRLMNTENNESTKNTINFNIDNKMEVANNNGTGKELEEEEEEEQQQQEEQQREENENKERYNQRVFPVNVPLPMVHWELAWGFFQLLNRENPTWYTLLDPDECNELIMYLLEVLCRGVDPWMCLNIARRAAALHLVDGVEISLWLLHRLDSSHHIEEAREVATQIFRWLLADVGMHLQPAMHYQLIPCARVLIRFNLHDELRSLYNTILDNVYTFSENFRDGFLSVLSDLTCSSCAAMLPSVNVYTDRVCPNCLHTTLAKDVEEMPSFQLSAEHLQLIRDKRKEARFQARQKMHDRLHKFSTQSEMMQGVKTLTKFKVNVNSNNTITPGNYDASISVRREKLPLEAAELFKRVLLGNKSYVNENEEGMLNERELSKYLLLPGVSTNESASLFPIEEDDNNNNNINKSSSTSMNKIALALSAMHHDGRNNNRNRNGITNRPVLLSPGAALEESNRRLEMQKAARLYALLTRGQLDAQSLANMNLPSWLQTNKAAALTSTTIVPELPEESEWERAAIPLRKSSFPLPSLVSAKIPIEGAWTCVWCQEHNSEWSSRTHCGACGAETGPGAAWRKFTHPHASKTAYVKKEASFQQAQVNEEKVDVMQEVRIRIANSAINPSDAVGAGYLLMVYRRLFLLRATPHDFNRLTVLIERLCANQEKILAGYLYMRLLPPQLRRKDHVAYTLCALFGNNPHGANMPLSIHASERENAIAERFLCLEQVSDSELQKNEKICFTVIFGPQTCKVCFASHDERVCPIMTRDFSKVRRAVAINLTTSEKRADVMKFLRHRIRLAVEGGRVNSKRIVDAYASFVSSAFRETFAQCYSVEVNQLSILLSECKQYRRAAFVLIHVPLFARWNEAYAKFIHYFNVTEEDAMQLLANRPFNKQNVRSVKKMATMFTNNKSWSAAHGTTKNIEKEEHVNKLKKSNEKDKKDVNYEQQEEEEEKECDDDGDDEEEDEFGKESDEERIAKVIAAQANDAQHPNFVQVAMTCCMCLDEKHASFQCPRLHNWLETVHTTCYHDENRRTSLPARMEQQTTIEKINNNNNNDTKMQINNRNYNNNNHINHSGVNNDYDDHNSVNGNNKALQQTLKRLRAQVDGWINAGPERLHAFYRFLLEHIDLYDDLFSTRVSANVNSHERHVSNINNTVHNDVLDREANMLTGGTAVREREVGQWSEERLFDSSADISSVSLRSVRRSINWTEPLIYALNRTIVKLAILQKRSEAYRLYARAPARCVAASTIIALLKLNGYRVESIQSMLYTPLLPSVRPTIEQSTNTNSISQSTSEVHIQLINKFLRATSSSDSIISHQYHSYATMIDDLITPTQTARSAAVPLHSRCYICFEHTHAYFDCPELLAQPTMVAKLLYILTHVGKLRFSHEGINAAANYVYYVYNRGKLPSPENWRLQPQLVAQLVELIHRCFASREVGCGVRVLRRLPLEMVPVLPTYTSLWKSAGLSTEMIHTRECEMLALFDAEGITPSFTNPSPRKSYSNKFIFSMNRAIHDDLCRHCYLSTHTISTCSVFHAEVSFGRDYVAAYRMSMMSEQLDRDWQDAYLLKLIVFHYLHTGFMPYHIVGVTNALNAIAAMWSFRGEPGIALWHLLNIPPAYRRRTAFKHILYSLNISMKDITEILSRFYFAPDDIGSTNNSNNSSSSSSSVSGGVIAQHLLLPKAAIRDVALKNVFEHFPVAMTALDESLARMKRIALQHEAFDRICHDDSSSTLNKESISPNKATPPSSSSSPSSSSPSSSSASASASSSHSSLYEPYTPNTSSTHDALHAMLNHANTKITTQPSTVISQKDDNSNRSVLAQQLQHYKGNERVWNAEIITMARMLKIQSFKMQSGDINVLREDFDPILSELENAVGMKLGSRHILFTTAIDILGSSLLSSTDEKRKEEEANVASNVVEQTNISANNNSNTNVDQAQVSNSATGTKVDTSINANVRNSINAYEKEFSPSPSRSNANTESEAVAAAANQSAVNVASDDVNNQQTLNSNSTATSISQSQEVQSSFTTLTAQSSFVNSNIGTATTINNNNRASYHNGSNARNRNINYAQQQHGVYNSNYRDNNYTANVNGNPNTFYRERGRGGRWKSSFHNQYNNNSTNSMSRTTVSHNQQQSVMPPSTPRSFTPIQQQQTQQQQQQYVDEVQTTMPETSFAFSAGRNRGKRRSERAE